MLHVFSPKKHETQSNITWSELNHPSLSKRSTGCTRQDLEREHSILLVWRQRTGGCIVCVALSNWVKNVIFVLPRFDRSAEAQAIWGGIVKRLLIAYFIGNISAKKISKSIHVHQSYSKPKVGRFFETWCKSLKQNTRGCFFLNIWLTLYIILYKSGYISI